MKYFSSSKFIYNFKTVFKIEKYVTFKNFYFILFQVFQWHSWILSKKLIV